ncbi:GEVED domain-containing protein [Flavobacterium sp.]|uniref:GEVED domain-containing protein n=1 Tax=Flavobacterium sp. TaxID=239 RepID=UPI0026170D91|nr:GEVED domain-containing protein [Flavobacterium sp.]MDD3004454.1 GEVED domain-containing protein [Flavobacterium sp.]
MNQNYNQEVADRGNFLKVKRYWRGWLMFYIMFLMSVSSYAQVADYLFSQENGTYQSIINNGTLVTGSNATISDYNDTKGWNITLPFSFKFNNIHYTSIYVNSNGGAIFGSDTNTGSSLISSSSSYSGAIAVMNRDLRGNFVTSGTTTSGSNLITNVASFEGISQGMDIESGGGIQSNTTILGYNTVARTITMSKNATSSFATTAVRYATGAILYKVDGVSPNRTFTIQWEGYNDYATDIVGSNYLSFQLKLEEGTHKIKMVYGTSYTVQTYNKDYEIGLRGASNTDYNNRTFGVDNSWSNTIAGTSNSAKVSRNNINYPTPGLTFVWTPSVITTVPNCIAASPTTPVNNATGITNKTFTWSSASGGVLGYKLYVGSNEGASDLINGLDVGNVLTYTLSEINYLPNTQYFWKVIPYNNFGDANGCVAWKFTTLNVPSCATLTFPTSAAINVVRNTTLTWTAPTSSTVTSYDVYLGTSSSPNFVTNVTATTYSPSALLANTTYYWKVVPKNSMGSGQDCIIGSFTTGSDLVYCNPSSVTWETYINNFSTTLGSTNISNLNSGYTTGGYHNNYNTTPVTSYPTGTFNYNLTVVGGTLGAAIWVDWNSSGTFETSERVFVTSSYGSGPFTGTITIPAGTALGDYRMRVMVDYNNNAPSNPCMTVNARTETEDYKITVGPQPSCVVPTGFSASDITFATAKLNWTASTSNPSNGYDVYYSLINAQPTTGTTPTVNNHIGTSLSLTTLNASTNYYWWLRSDCDSGTSSWVYGGSFVTLCQPLIAPTAVESFNDYNGVAPTPLCWSERTGVLSSNTTLTGTTSLWMLNTNGFANASSVNKGVSINLYSTKNDWIISPPIDLGTTPGMYRLKYRYAVTGYNATSSVSNLSSHKVNVVISTDGGSTWSNGNILKVYTGTSSYSNTGVYEVINLTNYSGVVKIAFVATTSSTTPDVDFHIDDFSIETLPSCIEPTVFSATNITTNSVTLNWNASSSNPSNGYDVYYSVMNTNPTAGTTPTINNHNGTLFNATTLNASTTYYWWLRSDCGNDASAWAYGGTFTTLCEAVSEFSQNWDALVNPALPLCFTKVGGLGTLNTQNSNAASGTNTLYMYASGTSNEPTLALPIINNAQAGTHWLKFKLRANSSVGGKLQVGYLTNPADASTFVTIQEFTASTLTYTDYTSIPGVLPNGVNTLALRAKGSPAYSMLIDDLVWESLPSCIAPTDLSVTLVSLSSANLSWNASVSDALVGYQWEVRTSGLPGSGNTGLSASGVTEAGITNAVASNLDLNSTVILYVRALCQEDSYSSWTSSSPFLINYCLSVPASNDASGITNVKLGDTSLVVSDVTYYNHPAVIDLQAGVLSNSAVTFATGYTYNTHIWIDLNNNGTFENSEKLFSGESLATNPTVFSTPFTIPANTLPGNYKLRIGTADSGQATPNPCYNGTFGVTVDATINVLAPPSCLVPSNFVSADVTINSATLSWTASTTNPSNGYDVYYSTINTAPTAGTTPSVNNHNSNSLNITELTHSSIYYWWVRSDCGTESSVWIYGGSFTTLCDAVTVLPWIENFDSVTTPALPACTSIYNAGSGNNWKTTSAPSSYTGLSGKVLNYGFNSSNAANAWFYTPGISLVANTAYLISYNYGNASGATQYPERMKVAVGSSPTHTAMTTELVNHPNITGGIGQSSSINFTPSVSGVYYFGFNAYSLADQNQLYVDNIKIEIPPQWTGVTSADWNTASNWSNNVVPTVNTNVFNSSLNPMIISSDVTIASMTLGAAANVTVNQHKTLNVGNITIAEGGSLTIGQDADILQPPTAVNTGKATVKVNSSNLFRQDYTLWSSPVTGQNLRNFSPQTLFNRFSSYDTALGTAGDYVQEIVTTADMNTKTFVNAKGYMIRMPNNWINYNDGLGAIPYEGQFKGTLNNGNLEIPLSLANTKLNLVGNPYPSSISINAFFAANPGIIQNTLYFWRKQASANPANASKSGYITYTSAGIVSADELLNGYTITHIHAGQGFFVQSNTATTLNFNNSMRSNLTDTFFRSSNETSTELHRFWLNLSTPNGKVGQTLVAYMTGATQGADEGIDALYFNDGAIALTTIVNNSEYIIQGRSLPFTDTDIVPLGFKTDAAGYFTISLSNFDGLFADDQAIYLRDNTAGVVHNLKSSDYSFTTPAGVFNTRFEVLYNTTLGTNNPALTHNNILVGVKDQIIQINAGNVTMEKIELIDVSGRVIYTQDGVNATTATLENVVMNNQMLIVRIHTKENVIVTQKIIF